MAKAISNNTQVPEVTIEAAFTQDTPCHFTINKQDYHLFKGETNILPDCDFVQTLIAKGHLKTV